MGRLPTEQRRVHPEVSSPAPGLVASVWTSAINTADHPPASTSHQSASAVMMLHYCDKIVLLLILIFPPSCRCFRQQKQKPKTKNQKPEPKQKQKQKQYKKETNTKQNKKSCLLLLFSLNETF